MNPTNVPLLAAFLGLLALFVAGIFLGLALGRRAGRLEVEKELPDRLEAERDDAVKRSRAVVGGQVAEQLAPYLPDFPCDPGDARFVGKPIDFVC
ncbi:MAG: Holliday junction resolvase-like protein, partial [Spirochaetales bacterium]